MKPTFSNQVTLVYKMKSMHGKAFRRIRVGSTIICIKSYEVVRKSILVPSMTNISFLHNFDSLALESSITTQTTSFQQQYHTERVKN